MSDTWALLLVIVLCAMVAWLLSWWIRLLVLGCERLLLRAKHGKIERHG
jgi:hypothetical protein